MERTRRYFLILVAFMMCNCLFAQIDQVVKIDQNDMMMQNSAKYVGKQFYYYNVLHYSGNVLQEPPYPYSNGRVRNGKYKASTTALDEYIKTIPNLNGKKFTFVKFMQENMNSNMGVVMAQENGDTLFFQMYSAMGEFVGADVFDSLKKTEIGKEVYCKSVVTASKTYSQYPALAYFCSFKDVKSGDLFSFLPLMSKWKVTDVSYSPDYIGNVTQMNDGMNAMYVRIKYTIENSKYGKFEYFPYFNLQAVPLVTIQNEDLYSDLSQVDYNINRLDLSDIEIKALTAWASKGYIEAQYNKILMIDRLVSDSIPQEVMNFAMKGYLPALVSCLRRYPKLKDADLEALYGVVLKTYKSYGKLPVCRDLLKHVAIALQHSYHFLPTAAQKSARLDEAIDVYKKAIECGYVDKDNDIKRCVDEKSKIHW